MRFTILVLFFAVAFCNEVAVTTPSNDLVDDLRCAVDMFIPLKPDIFKLLDAIEAKDTGEIAAYVLKLAGAFSDIYLKCFKHEPILALNMNWQTFGKCLLEKVKQTGADFIPTIKEIIDAIKLKDWATVAKLAAPLLFKGVDSVVKCVKESK